VVWTSKWKMVLGIFGDHSLLAVAGPEMQAWWQAYLR
jgi:hypothetical protein